MCIRDSPHTDGAHASHSTNGHTDGHVRTEPDVQNAAELFASPGSTIQRPDDGHRSRTNQLLRVRRARHHGDGRHDVTYDRPPTRHFLRAGGRYPRRHARRTGAPDVDTGRKGHRPDNTRYDAGDHRPYAFDRSLWRGRTREYRAHPGNLAPRRVQPRRLGHSHHLIHEYRGDRYDDHDDANVSHDVPQRRVLPDIADATIYAGHRAVPSAHLRDWRAATSGSARCGRASNFKGHLHTLRFRDRFVVSGAPRVRAGDEAIIEEDKD